jgi:stage II sporulation protein D
MKRFVPSGWRRDFAVRRTLANCFLMAALLITAGVFFSCRQRLVVISTPQMKVEPRYWVRVLLAENVRQCRVRFRNGFSLLNNFGAVLVPDTILTERGVPMDIGVSAGLLSIAGRTFTENELTMLPDKPGIFMLDDNDYRGKLLLKVDPDGDTFNAINIVPIEPYLASVVGAEMPQYWQIETLKAQAIAARTYCLYNKARFGAARGWDVTRTAASQVYKGIRSESFSSWQAVNDTLGQVLTCLHEGGVEEIFPAYYSSTCGGHTEDAKNVFGDSFTPLCGVPCTWCRDVAKPYVFFWPMVKFDKQAVSAALFAKYPKLFDIGDIVNITADKQSDYNGFSRLTMVKLVGSTGKFDFVRAEDLRLTIDPAGSRLRSTACKILLLDNDWAFLDGRGFGHAVGLCQCGAEGLARQGKNCAEILSYYYPGAKLSRAY